MKTHVYVKMLVSTLLLCSCLYAQTRPPRPPRPSEAETQPWHGIVGVSIGSMPRAYRAPIVTGYGGVEYNGRNVFSRTIARVGYARKIDTNDGCDAGFETGVYVGGAHVLAGGGVNYAYQKTSLYSKDSLHPTVGVAMRWRTSREIAVHPDGHVTTYDTQILFISRMLLPGRDSSNALLGPKFTFLVPITTRWRIGSDFGFYSFRPSGQNAPRTWTAAFAGNIEFRF